MNFKSTGKTHSDFPRKSINKFLAIIGKGEVLSYPTLVGKII